MMGSATLAVAGGPPPRPNNSGRLRYANAEDLPSYPSTGLKKDGAAAGAAATLGWANIKKLTDQQGSGPKPEATSLPASSPASTAALLASDGRFGLAKGGDQSTAVEKTVPRHLSLSSSTWGTSAASLAFKASRTPATAPLHIPPSPQATTENQSLTRRSSMRAAKGAMVGLRPRASSSPPPSFRAPAETYPDQANAAANALSAATIAHRPSVRSSTHPLEAGAVPYTTMDRQMYTSNPPVKPEMEEQKRAEVLHASALAMAKRMYNPKKGSSTGLAHSRSLSVPQAGTGGHSLDDQEHAPAQLTNLQEAAYRLAQERLAKLQEEHQRNRDLQDYYGSANPPQRSKFGNLRGKLTRRRSSSDGDLIQDRWRSQQIRRQMSMLNNKLTEVDEEKRAHDRQALLAAAQRNVKAQLQDMDEKLSAEKAPVFHVTTGDWERKARVAAQTRFDATSNKNAGMVDLGGGKFMERSAVEEIAAKRVQPLLDEINEKAELEKERRELQRIEEERKKEEAEKTKMRDKEIQEIHKKLKDQQKEDERNRKAEIKHEEKLRKDEAKAIKAEQKRHAKDEKQKDKEEDAVPVATTVLGGPPVEASEETPSSPPQTQESARPISRGRTHALSIPFARRQAKNKGKEAEPVQAERPPTPENDVVSPPRNLRNWLRSRLPRPRAKSSSSVLEKSEIKSTDSNDRKGKSVERESFVGGAALAKRQGRPISIPSWLDPRSKGTESNDKKTTRPKSWSDADADASASIREVALAGRAPLATAKPDEVGESSMGNRRSTQPTAPPAATLRHPSPPARPVSALSAPISERPVSSLGEDEKNGRRSSVSSEEAFEEARSHLASPLTPPPKMSAMVPTGRASPVRNSRFSEILD